MCSDTSTARQHGRCSAPGCWHPRYCRHSRRHQAHQQGHRGGLEPPHGLKVLVRRQWLHPAPTSGRRVAGIDEELGDGYLQGFAGRQGLHCCPCWLIQRVGKVSYPLVLDSSAIAHYLHAPLAGSSVLFNVPSVQPPLPPISRNMFFSKMGVTNTCR